MGPVLAGIGLGFLIVGGIVIVNPWLIIIGIVVYVIGMACA